MRGAQRDNLQLGRGSDAKDQTFTTSADDQPGVPFQAFEGEQPQQLPQQHQPFQQLLQQVTQLQLQLQQPVQEHLEQSQQQQLWRQQMLQFQQLMEQLLAIDPHQLNLAELGQLKQLMGPPPEVAAVATLGMPP